MSFVREKSDSTHLAKGSDRLCSHCFTPIYRGNGHTAAVCKAKSTAITNLADGLGSKVRDGLVHEVIKEKVSAAGDSSFSLQGPVGGKPLTVMTGKAKSHDASKSVLTAAEIQIIQNQCNMSDR